MKWRWSLASCRKHCSYCCGFRCFFSLPSQWEAVSRSSDAGERVSAAVRHAVFMSVRLVYLQCSTGRAGSLSGFLAPTKPGHPYVAGNRTGNIEFTEPAQSHSLPLPLSLSLSLSLSPCIWYFFDTLCLHIVYVFILCLHKKKNECSRCQDMKLKDKAQTENSDAWSFFRQIYFQEVLIKP